MITHPSPASAPATVAHHVAHATTTYVAAADLLSIRFAPDPAVRTSVVRWTPAPGGPTSGHDHAPSIDFVLDQAGELLVGLVVEDASQWLPARALRAATGACAPSEVTASGRLWVSLLPEAPAVWRSATRVAVPGGSPAVQLLWAPRGRLVAVEVEDVGRLHPTALLQGVPAGG